MKKQIYKVDDIVDIDFLGLKDKAKVLRYNEHNNSYDLQSITDFINYPNVCIGADVKKLYCYILDHTVQKSEQSHLEIISIKSEEKGSKKLERAIKREKNKLVKEKVREKIKKKESEKKTNTSDFWE